MRPNNSDTTDRAGKIKLLLLDVDGTQGVGAQPQLAVRQLLDLTREMIAVLEDDHVRFLREARGTPDPDRKERGETASDGIACARASAAVHLDSPASGKGVGSGNAVRQRAYRIGVRVSQKCNLARKGRTSGLAAPSRWARGRCRRREKNAGGGGRHRSGKGGRQQPWQPASGDTAPDG